MLIFLCGTFLTKLHLDCVLHILCATECVRKWENQQKKFWAYLMIISIHQSFVGIIYQDWMGFDGRWMDGMVNDLLRAPSVLIRSDTFPCLHWD